MAFTGLSGRVVHLSALAAAPSAAQPHARPQPPKLPLVAGVTPLPVPATPLDNRVARKAPVVTGLPNRVGIRRLHCVCDALQTNMHIPKTKSHNYTNTHSHEYDIMW